MVPIRIAVSGPLCSLDRNEYISDSRRQRRVCEGDKGVEYWVEKDIAWRKRCGREIGDRKESKVPAEAVRTNDIRLSAARVLSALIHVVFLCLA